MLGRSQVLSLTLQCSRTHLVSDRSDHLLYLAANIVDNCQFMMIPSFLPGALAGAKKFVEPTAIVSMQATLLGLSAGLRRSSA